MVHFFCQCCFIQCDIFQDCNPTLATDYCTSSFFCLQCKVICNRTVTLCKGMRKNMLITNSQCCIWGRFDYLHCNTDQYLVILPLFVCKGVKSHVLLLNKLLHFQLFKTVQDENSLQNYLNPALPFLSVTFRAPEMPLHISCG